MAIKLPLNELRNTAVVFREGSAPEHLLELDYWKRILQLLQARLSAAQLDGLYFQLVFGNASLAAAPETGYTNVFIIADEYQQPRPDLYDGRSIVFQSSYSGRVFKGIYNKIFPFPIGYNGKLDLENPLPFAERPINVFFSGNLHRGRRRMFSYYSYLRYLPFALQHRLQARLKSTYDRKYPQSYLRFTSGFMQGLNFEQYADYIKKSKIVLTPHGSLAEECFRHYEAMKCGCIIISERLPENDFFSESPIIQIDEWADGDHIIRQLLADPARMQALHVEATRWWREVMSEPAVAAYMQARIEQCVTSEQ